MPIKQAKAMLPNIPDEVFDGFLSPLIDSFGWPFSSVSQILDGTEWCRILYPLTLPELSALKWNRKLFTLESHSLYKGSVADLEHIIRNKVENIWAPIGRDSTPCRMSLLWHEADIMETGKFCSPITIAKTPTGWKILDGNHRVAALFTLDLVEKVQIDAWVGSPPVIMA